MKTEKYFFSVSNALYLYYIPVCENARDKYYCVFCTLMLI